jgi:hypothetical protein
MLIIAQHRIASGTTCLHQLPLEVQVMRGNGGKASWHCLPVAKHAARSHNHSTTAALEDQLMLLQNNTVYTCHTWQAASAAGACTYVCKGC